MSRRRYDVIILAGHGTQVADFVAASGHSAKALMPLDGRPMVTHVIRAIEASEHMGQLAIVGIEDDTLELDLNCPVTFVPNQVSMLDNLLSALDALHSVGPVLSASADIPLITKESVIDFVQRSESSGADLCYPIVEQAVMAARFPESGRSFRQIADGAFAGGDMMRFDADVPRRNMPLIRALTAQRKSAWGLVRALGVGTLMRYATGRLRLVDIEHRAGQLLHCSAKAIISPYAELAMDVDTAAQLQIVRQALSSR